MPVPHRRVLLDRDLECASPESVAGATQAFGCFGERGVEIARRTTEARVHERESIVAAPPTAHDPSGTATTIRKMHERPEPGDRRRAAPATRPLERPPGERYVEAEDPRDAAAPPTASRAILVAILLMLAGAALIVVLGGVFSLSAGLLVVAGVIGWAVGGSISMGRGMSVDAGMRRWLAIALAVASIVLGQVGLWLYAATEGGSLGLVDYLVQSRGLLVPLEALVAGCLAWWAAT